MTNPEGLPKPEAESAIGCLSLEAESFFRHSSFELRHSNHV